MINDWKEFESLPNKRVKDGPRVTLNTQGVFLMNRITYEALGQPPAVTFLFDEGQRMVGLKPVDPSRANAFPISMVDRCSNRKVAANPFCRHYNLKPTRTILFNNPEIDNDGVLKLDLRDVTAIGGIRKPRRKP